MVLAGGEFTEINTENSMLIIDQLVNKFWWLCPMRELIFDHEASLEPTESTTTEAGTVNLSMAN
jgi:hypothetical protein